MKGSVIFSLLLLLGMAKLASATTLNRRLLWITEAGGLTTQTLAKPLSVEEETAGDQMSSTNGDPDSTNHHSIPSQSWDSGQNPDHGSAEEAQPQVPAFSGKIP
ncbi:hypothetical protein Ancab_014515 [Ancistrocladus abbreviatus]